MSRTYLPLRIGYLPLRIGKMNYSEKRLRFQKINKENEEGNIDQSSNPVRLREL